MRSTTLAGTRTLRSHDATFEYPSTARPGRHAARLWFDEPTPLSLAQFRDKHFRDHCQGKHDSPGERNVRKSAACVWKWMSWLAEVAAQVSGEPSTTNSSAKV